MGSLTPWYVASLHPNTDNSTEKSLSEHGAKLSEDDKAAITKTIEEAKAAMEKEDAEDLTEKVRQTLESQPDQGDRSRVHKGIRGREGRLKRLVWQFSSWCGGTFGLTLCCLLHGCGACR